MKIITTLFTLFIVLSAVLGISAIIVLKSMAAPGPLAEEKVILIENGLSASAIADKLEDEGVITSTFLFKTALKLFGQNSLKAGEYKLEKQIPIIAVLEKLEEGKTVSRNLTVPEGLTSFEVAKIVQNADFMTGQLTKIPAEGSLLPETYSYSRGEDREAKIVQMQKDMTAFLEEQWEGREADLPLQSKEEALTLASIIEKETGKPEERKRIAGVFVNRLTKGIPLQTDPTVIYALTKGRPESKGKGPLGRRLLKKDLEIDSPYNTYKYAGLPPGPIANPGKDSIIAALHPEQHDELFFVADGTGGHLFAKTLEEHNYNVANWRKIRLENEKKAAQKSVITDEVDEPLFGDF